MLLLKAESRGCARAGDGGGNGRGRSRDRAGLGERRGGSGSPGRLDSHFVSFVTSQPGFPPRRGRGHLSRWAALRVLSRPGGALAWPLPMRDTPLAAAGTDPFRPSAVLARSAAGGTETRRLDGVQEYPGTFPYPRPAPYSSRFLPLPIRKQLVFMFLQIMSKFRTPGNKRSFVRSARSLERAINDAPRPAAPGSGTFPARAAGRDPRNRRAGGGEGLRYVPARPENRERALCRRGAPWALPAGIPPFGPAGAGAPQGTPPREPVAAGHAWASPTSSADAGDSPAFVGLCSWEERRLLSAVGTAAGKSPALCPGLGTAPGGSCGRSAPLNRRCRGAARGGGGGSAPLGWQERRRLRRGRSRHFQEDGATYGKHLEFTGPAGTRREAQRFRAAPSGRGRAAPAAFRAGPWSLRGAWPPRSSVPTAPGRMCGSVPGRRRDPSGTGAELRLLGAVVSLTGRSLRNRAIRIEGAERSSSAQGIGGVPEGGILSLPLCPSTPRSLHGSASPLRCPDKGQQPYPVPCQASAGSEPCPGATVSASATSPPEPPGKPCPVMNSMSNTRHENLHGNFWGLMDRRRRRCMGTPGVSPPRTGYPRAARQQPRRHCAVPVPQLGADRCLLSCLRAARKRKGGVSGAGLSPQSRTAP